MTRKEPEDRLTANNRNHVSIVDDLEAGEAAVLLTKLPRESYVPRGRSGKPLHFASAFRWASNGLETLSTPSGMITTRGAVLRYFSKLSGKSLSPRRRTSRQRERAISRANQELAAAGI